MTTLLTELREEIIKKLMKMDLGYRWQMSEIASSALIEQTMEAKGVKEVNKTADQILFLVLQKVAERVEGMKKDMCQELVETGTCGHYHADDRPYNQAIDDILDLLPPADKGEKT